jgi:putative transposase
VNDTIREQPHRLPRECYRGRVTVAFTACIKERRSPFREARVVKQFLELLQKSVEKNLCLVPIYCFMPDHLHLILQGLEDSADTWKAMVDFKQQSGYWFGRNLPQFAWQKDFYDHVIRAHEDLGAQIRYFADNPVRKALVPVWSDYPFTGAIGIDLKEILVDASTPGRVAAPFRVRPARTVHQSRAG